MVECKSDRHFTTQQNINLETIFQARINEIWEAIPDCGAKVCRAGGKPFLACPPRVVGQRIQVEGNNAKLYFTELA